MCKKKERKQVYSRKKERERENERRRRSEVGKRGREGWTDKTDLSRARAKSPENALSESTAAVYVVTCDANSTTTKARFSSES